MIRWKFIADGDIPTNSVIMVTTHLETGWTDPQIVHIGDYSIIPSHLYLMTHWSLVSFPVITIEDRHKAIKALSTLNDDFDESYAIISEYKSKLADYNSLIATNTKS